MHSRTIAVVGVLLAGAIGISAGHAQTPSATRLDEAELEAFVQDVRERFNLPGVTVAVVTAQGPVLVRGYGVRQWDRPERVDADTSFPIYSTSKIFLGTAIARLVEQGRLSYDDRVTRWVPEFKVESDEVTRLATVRDLLNHGLGTEDFGDWLENAPGVEPRDALARLAVLPQKVDLHQVYYSGIETIVLAVVLERVTNLSWERAIRELVLEPLQLKRTFVRPREFVAARHIAPTGDGWVEGLKTGLAALGSDINFAPPQSAWPPGAEEWVNDPRERGTHVLPFQESAIDPAQSAFTSAADMARYMTMMLRNGRADETPYLKPETLIEMTRLSSVSRPQWGHGRARDAVGFDPWIQSLGYAQPFQAALIAGHQCYGHSGGSLGAESRMYVCPSMDLGVFVAATGPLYLDGATSVVMRHVFARRLALDDPLGAYATRMLNAGQESLKRGHARWARELAELPTSSGPLRPLSDYVGRYHHPFAGVVSAYIRKDTLHVTAGTGALWDLQRLSGNRFIATWNGPRRLKSIQSFEAAPDGTMSALSLTSQGGGPPLTFRRIDPEGP